MENSDTKKNPNTQNNHNRSWNLNFLEKKSQALREEHEKKKKAE